MKGGAQRANESETEERRGGGGGEEGLAKRPPECAVVSDVPRLDSRPRSLAPLDLEASEPPTHKLRATEREKGGVDGWTDGQREGWRVVVENWTRGTSGTGVCVCVSRSLALSVSAHAISTETEREKNRKGVF